MLLFSCKISDNYHRIVLGSNIHIPDLFTIKSIRAALLETIAITMQTLVWIVSGTNIADNANHPSIAKKMDGSSP
jgi:hypothetical protein